MNELKELLIDLCWITAAIEDNPQWEELQALCVKLHAAIEALEITNQEVEPISFSAS